VNSVNKVKSRDGTTIACEATGAGPALVLVGGAFNDRAARAAGTPLAALLAHHFTVWTYDRRGRGDSEPGSADAPTVIAREVEDLAAVIGATGGSASVYGMSSGALLGLTAALQNLPIRKLALYEPPLKREPAEAQACADLADQLEAATAAGRRDQAAELFLTCAMQMPAAAVASMQQSPMWPKLEALADTLSHDMLLAASGPALFDRAASLPIPTLVIDGDASPPGMREGVRVLAARLPAGRQRTLTGQTHDVDIKALAPLLDEFFSS
jgi:pimeloyl-ACP methyl ester carboxylesterase